MSGKKRKKAVKKKGKPNNREKAKQQEEAKEIPGWLLFLFSSMLFLSLVSFAYAEGDRNWLGLAGYTLGWLAMALFGVSSYTITIYVGWIGYKRVLQRPIEDLLSKHVQLGLLVFSTNMLLTLFEAEFPQFGDLLRRIFFTQLLEQKLHFHLGGAPAFFLYHDLPFCNLNRIINTYGVAIVFLSTGLTSATLLANTSPYKLLRGLFACRKFFWLKGSEEIGAKEHFLRFVKLRIPGSTPETEAPLSCKKDIYPSEMLEIKPEKNLLVRPSLSRKVMADPLLPASYDKVLAKGKQQIHPPLSPKHEGRLKRKEKALVAQRVHNGDFKGFKLPPHSLLTNPKKVDQSTLKKDLRRQAEVLEETLLSFGIEAKVGQINCGPTITSFEVHPSIGVKVQKIKALESDIALNLEAKSIRILAPIPGKAAIGIEVPNSRPQEVGFKEMLASYLQRGSPAAIPVLLGKTVSGEYVMHDLVKMPHVIIAGATGSGKSVCINTIVMSILMTAKPDAIKFLMIDPKKVELTPYSQLPHMLAPVITEPGGACAALSWLVKEMERRYEILKVIGLRNIASYNTRKIDKDFEESLDKEIPERLHYIVCIIDELADLMMVSSNDIETYIARIAQMARAVGIHMILATQRPSREVITGLIKANFPTRISFKVSSRVNSQIILDEIGAEDLLGNGDMLFLPPGSHHLVRAQGAYIRDEDINAVNSFICEQAPPSYVIKSFDDRDENDQNLFFGLGDEPKDALLRQARDVVLATGSASASFLQRKLKVGYPKAASLIDQLEDEGVIGPAQGSKPREILLKKEGSD